MTGALNDTTLMEYMERGKQIVRPFSKESLQPASIDLRLGCETYKYNLTGLTLGEDIEDSNIERDKFERRDMAPGETAFIGTYEEIMIPKDCLGVIFPRSSVSRLGIIITTMYMNPGYTGRPALTIINNSGITISISTGIRVAQLVLVKLISSPTSGYNNKIGAKYHNEVVASSKIHKDEDIKKILDSTLEKETPSLYKLMKK